MEAIKPTDKAEAPDLLKLICIAGPCTGTTFKKQGSSLTIGRTSKSKIWVKDPSVSEKHGKLEWDGSGWTLQDVGSSNGTSINGVALQEGKAVGLKDGDIVLLGEESRVRVEIMPLASENMTVEEYLQAECARMEQRIKAHLEQTASKMMDSWLVEKQKILELASTSRSIATDS